jgi:pimeloyl-ACP methyl ester carboxylesterase
MLKKDKLMTPEKILKGKLVIPVIIILVLALPYFIPDLETTSLDEPTRRELGGSFIQLSDGYTHYRLEGPIGGPPVVLIHGFSVPLFNWDHTVPALIRTGFRVLRYDLYGRGLSDRPRTNYTKELFDRQLHELLAALKIKTPVDLVGLSMGGAVATIFAARHPDKVAKLALFAPVGFPVNIPFTGKLVRLPILGPYLMRAVGDRTLLKSVRKGLHSKDKFPEYLDKFKIQMAYHGYKRAIVSTLQHFDLSNQATEFKKAGQHPRPVQVFWGKADRIVPYDNSVKVLETLSRATLFSVADAGHVLPYENADTINPVLVKFLTSG